MTNHSDRYTFRPIGAFPRPGDVRRGHRAVREGLTNLVSDTDSYCDVLKGTFEELSAEERVGGSGLAVGQAHRGPSRVGQGGRNARAAIFRTVRRIELANERGNESSAPRTFPPIILLPAPAHTSHSCVACFPPPVEHPNAVQAPSVQKPSSTRTSRRRRNSRASS